MLSLLTFSLLASAYAFDFAQVGNHFHQLVLSSFNASLPFFHNFVANGDALADLKALANDSIVHFLTDLDKDKPSLECDACTGLLATLKAIAEFGDDELKDTVGSACSASKLEDDDVCRGLANEEGAAAAEILRSINPAGYAGKLFCSTIVGVCDYPAVVESNMTFPAPPANILAPHASDPSAPPLTVVHFSDWHYDPLYVAGTEAQCTKPLCCRGFNASSPRVASHPAASWGSYECDTPLKLGISMLQSIAPALGKQPDFTIFTGDVPPHDVWTSSPISATMNEATSYQLFHQYLKTKVYPTLGNHETSPVNLYQPVNVRDPPLNQYLYNNLTENAWLGWLDEDTLTYAREHRGSYVTRPVPGFKIISLNSNECYVDNFWLLIDAMEADPNGQLAWLAGELASSEAAGEKVWIISHVASGLADCLHNWSNLHNEIIQRYHKTITGIFSGHTHRDEYELYYSDDANKTPDNAIAINWIGPSVTPFTQLNPGWRYYTVDPTTFEVMDAVTYIANLSLAPTWDKTGEEPTWFVEYSTRSLLSTAVWPVNAPLNATFWARVTADFWTSDALFQRWYQYRGKLGPDSAGGCTGECKSNVIEGLMAGNSVGALHQSEFTRDIGTERSHAQTKPKMWNKDLCRLHSHH